MYVKNGILVGHEFAGYSKGRPQCFELLGSHPENSSTESNNSPATNHVVSLLDRLKAPKPFDLARKRKVASNPPPKGKKRCRRRGMNNPKSVTPSQRVKENPKECLTVSNKQLFCKACWEELSLISCVVHNHVKSAKHQAGKKRLAAKEVNDTDIAEALR